MGVTISRVVMMVVFTLNTCSAIAQETVLVEVFYRSSMHSEPQSRVPGADITPWNLDKPKLIKRQKPSITGTERDVREKVSDWLASTKGKAHLAAARESYRGFGQAMRYRIKKVPAIVLDGRQVVYGTTNVRKALMIYRGKQ